MNNEEKILKALEYLTEEVGSLKAGQTHLTEEVSSLKSGQTHLTEEVGSLKAGQANLTEKVSSLEAGQANLTEKVSSLEAGQAHLTEEVGSLKSGQAHLTQEVGSIKERIIVLEKGQDEMRKDHHDLIEFLQENMPTKKEVEEIARRVVAEAVHELRDYSDRQDGKVLSEIHGDIANESKKINTKHEAHIEIHRERGTFTEQEASSILQMEPFPKSQT